MEVFDIENFISEVEAHPAIWDSRTEVYSDREKRTQAWSELCLKFVPKFREKSVQEKNSAAAQLQRRWKSFRDCFKREHTKQMRALNTYAGSSGRKPYKYYQNLSFLINVIETKSEVSPPFQEEKDPELPSADKTKRKRKKPPSAEERDSGFSERFIMTQTDDEEADRNFALSLLPHLKQILCEHKLDAQMEILMVLKKYKPLGRQHFDYCLEARPGQQHLVAYSQDKASPLSTDDEHPMSDDSSINENLYH